MQLRQMTASDDVMPFVVAAMNWRDDGAWDADLVLADQAVAHYVTDWMRPGDAGVVAIEGGVPAGAAWWRHFTGDDPGYGYVADDVPELGLAVLASHRGKGIATALMTEIIRRAAAERVPGLSLSVEDGNGVARGLYDSLGFVKVGRMGDSDTLLLELAQ
ncbi:MAG: GNAT family N-acetyltransferase [Demequinaceae bacterium]|nr:GNAT family N-acetyltransferase [Demequinaceae bacterium]